MKQRCTTTGILLTGMAIALFFSSQSFAASESMIEQQLKELGSIANDEVVVVQRKFTRKAWRHEISPVSFGGVPFGTVRRTLMGGASYTLHVNDWFGWEVVNFAYTKAFFSSFTDDINAAQPGRPAIRPDFQKLLYFLTTGVQITPFYGKISTFSNYIAYLEPYLGLGVGISRTEAQSYLTFYPAIGIRAFFKEWVSMRLEFRDYMYTEKNVTRTDPPTEVNNFRNNYAVTVSLSFWLPKMPR